MLHILRPQDQLEVWHEWYQPVLDIVPKQPTDGFPAEIHVWRLGNEIITSSDAPTSLVVPSLIADVGDDASWRYVEFFTANIRNPNTRRAYARACSRFFGWCENRGLALAGLESLPRYGV